MTPLALAFSALGEVPVTALPGEEAFLAANALCDSRRYEEAVGKYSQAIAAGYADEVVWNNKGVALDSLGRHEEALVAYKESLRVDVKYAVAWHNLRDPFFPL